MRRFYGGILFAALAASVPIHGDAACASANPAAPADRHLYAGQYDLATNLWGIRGAGSDWAAAICTGSATGIDGAGYTWSGVGGDSNSVKAYASVRFGASNRHNVPAVSGLPYPFGSNAKHVDVVWDFTAVVAGRYNHTLDVFFNATNSTQQAQIRGEIMVVTASSQDAQTAGWGVRDAAPFVLDGATWDVWQATQASNGHRWHVTQFRQRVGGTHFHHDLRDFFAVAAARRPDIFTAGDYVMMVEAGTEIKTGAGRVDIAGFSVTVY